MIRKITFLLFPLFVLMSSVLFLVLKQTKAPRHLAVSEHIFSPTYPVHTRFIEETSQMRAAHKITQENENLIQVSTFNAGEALGIPQSLLWCLMFQESRLNHLSGLKEGKLSTGLGQFSVSAFFELNHHLPRYLSSPKAKLSSILGFDLRPLSADVENISDINSYYFIPTAVTATALYLNNRWVQLARIADERGLPYSPEVLWAWAALSYNKGGRTVLSLWNQIELQQGTEALEKALTNKDSFLSYALNENLVRQALKSIWSKRFQITYSTELLTHVENIRDCALNPKPNNFLQEKSL